MQVKSVLESVSQEEIDNFKFEQEKYYHMKYFVAGDENLDVLLRIHTNKLVLVSLASGNRIIKEGKTIQELDFNVTANINRQKNNFSGKHKIGAQKITPKSVLCYIKCTDGSRFPLYAGVSGKLLEINESVIKKPSLLIEDNEGLGYVAIIIPQLENFETYLRDDNA